MGYENIPTLKIENILNAQGYTNVLNDKLCTMMKNVYENLEKFITQKKKNMKNIYNERVSSV